MWWDENWDVELLMMKEWFEQLRLWNWNLLNWDWIDEKCELLVFDGNELVVLNGWLICGKARKKRDEIESIYYMMKWEIGQCEITPNDWYWKRWPEREKIEFKKMPRKGKDWNEKRCPNGKDCDEKYEKNGLPIINLHI